MKRTLSRILIFLLLIVLTGCRSEDPLRHFVVADSPQMFNVVTSVHGRTTPAIIDDVSYNLAFDDAQRLVTISIANLRTDENAPGDDVVFSEIEFTYEPGSHQKRRIIQAPELTSITLGGESVRLTDVTIVYSESNALSQEPTAGFYAEFTVNDSYNVLAYPYVVYADGTTTVCRSDSNATEIDYEPVYTLKLHPNTRRADISIDAVRIGTSVYTITLSDLLLTLSADGYDLAETASSRIKVSDASNVQLLSFSGRAVLRDELKVVFNLMLDGKDYTIEGFLTPDMSSKRD